MHIDFEGKRVLITGSSRGIGKGAAAAFLDAGASVALNGRSAASTDAGIAALGHDGDSCPPRATSRLLTAAARSSQRRCKGSAGSMSWSTAPASAGAARSRPATRQAGTR